ncbi:L7Ae/L30e/S12e/Gadd45 family ribosomal protein [Acetanaerobacterium elongatum]|uniref:Ribosomal protein L7Ae n=1 Tax=Acetanaerobacterium elongatum TaxID=258515 RepID=A0A1G9WPY3_9FIRM|nr:ribosomal L7Ae/L30e/S12e/Gadd45 family protein [Acetanaerobacterium elongatum]SDM86165.1 Ribosomal protein L7Ae [Acetanaerobacterium elongatum]
MDSDNAKLLAMIGMSRRAGKLVLGFDVVADTVRSGKVQSVFYASDISPKTLKELRFLCERESAEAVAVNATMDEIGHITAKRVGIFAVTDAGLRRKISELAECGGKI